MIVNRIAQKCRRHVSALLANLRARGVFYVCNPQGIWSFFWDGYYITEGLKGIGVRADMTDDPWLLRRQIIHFGDRYAFFNGPPERLHPSNKVFLTWFHGEASDPNPEMRRMLETLAAGAERLEGIVVTCEISRRVLIEAGVPAEKLTTIPLGVDLSRFVPVSAGQRERIRRELGVPENVVCIGSFQKDGAGWGDGAEPKLVKGPDVFLDAMARLWRTRKDLFVLLTGPARGYVKERLKRIGIPCLHRNLAQYHDIIPYYQALDLYVIASRAEGGPKALLESWATGVPVVSTRVGMPADLIEDGANGFLCDIEDAEALAEAASTLASDKALRARVAAKALETVRSYDWPLIAERYCRELYRPVIGSIEKPQ